MNKNSTNTLNVTSGGYSDIKEYLSKNCASGESQKFYQLSIKKKEDLNYGRS